jgi:hypothetical protein
MTKGQYYNQCDRVLNQLQKHEKEANADDFGLDFDCYDDDLFDRVDNDINDENDDYLWGS